MKVIPKVGQVWSVGGGEVEITSVDGDDVYFKSLSTAFKGKQSIAKFKKDCTFEPQTDLEWLAVNVDEWNGSCRFKLICRCEGSSDGANYHDETYDCNGYTRQQWQDKRNELFGEKPVTKMKVEYKHLTQANTDIWDLKLMLENQELFSRRSDQTYSLYSSNAAPYMVRHFVEYGVYRKVETPVTWQDEVNSKYGKYGAVVDSCGTFSMKKNCEIIDSNLISMCHLVASLTDNPNE